MSLEVSGLGFCYGDREVLRAVDLTAEPGSVLSLVGANGAGKTTLLKCLTGLLRPDRGTIRVHGQEMGRLSRRALARRLAYVPQSEPTRFPMTVFDTVLLGRRPYLGWYPRSRDLQVAAAALEQMSLSELAMRAMGELSGGERQRVAIAKAIAQEADIVLADEPTASLDLKHQLMVLQVVQSLARSGACVVMSIHDLNLAFRVSDRVLVLDHGQVSADGPPSAVTPEVIRAAYGVECDVMQVAGRPLVVPHRVTPEAWASPTGPAAAVGAS